MAAAGKRSEMVESGAARIEAPVIGKRDYGCITAIELETDHLEHARPGQFVHVDCGSEEGRILRRPYSLYDVRDGIATLMVRVVGSGSEWLAGREVGDCLDLLGPLGRAFDNYLEGGTKLLVAGGTGIVPLHFLSRRMEANDTKAVLLWGVERREDYRELPGILEEERGLRLCCEDGGQGFEGSALDLMDALDPGEYEHIYACGPKGMLVGLAERLDIKGLDNLQVSLEERMACGVGACRGCAVPARSYAGGYLMACSDGPVFNGKELDWERIGR
jgi:dihydroorotate dehydrogenase electron transfer subunit